MDAYDRTARLKPLGFLSAPLGFYATGLTVALPSWWRLLGAAGIAVTGLPLLAAQLIADAGKESQRKLWKAWGGPPTTLALRFAAAENRLAVSRRHQHVARATGVGLPTEAEETADPATADQAYAVATRELIELTRNEQRFPLVKNELTAYGFRRNLYGVKRIGVGGAAAVVLAAVVTAWLCKDHRLQWVPMVVAGVLALVVLAGWLLLVTPTFVRRGADRYADQLLAAAAMLPAAGASGGADR